MTAIEIVAEPGVPQVLVTREFAAPASKLLRAHTDPDLLARWLGPEGLQLTVDVLEPRDGGRWRYTQTDAKGERFSFFGLYHGTPSTQGIVQTYEFDRQPGRVYLNAISFEERGERTVLRQNTVFQSVEDRDYYVRGGMEVGLRASLDRLDALVTGRQ
ncbi:SRPBCC domain-containing protein [Asanoa sp. NPDC049573]|uniref:SRPBCC domain-containing protein n=1 Tax=Asanoa sp. NPDC049573 TaxID=3155396 RepID=UPI00343156EC